MNPERWRRVDLLLQEALEIGSEERGHFLDLHCGQDEELRHEVEALLDSAQRSENYMERPGLRWPGELLEGPLEDPWQGRQLGAYRILKLLGRGGMSSVYLAERADQEFQGKAAVKIMRPLPGDTSFLERFRRERQILADLSHPNIARLIDSGTAFERPYFVMEYIDGEPIDTHCDNRGLSIRDRVQLFLKICAAVSHAHQNLVIHRDLKPNNVLVNYQGVPKLLDFGIAKILEPKDLAGAATQTAGRLLTPDFASPEQVFGGQISVTTDVYSLGLLLFRLLAGAAPYRLTGVSVVEVERILRDANWPSLSEVAASADESTSGARGLSSKQLSRRLEGDLEKIVAKALRRDPELRYGSVEQLGLDLRRHLEGRPILALPPSVSYRLGRYLRREKLAVTVMVALALLAASSSIFAYRSSLQQARILAEQERASAVSSFLVEVFDAASPGLSRGSTVTARELLDNAYSRFQGQLQLHPRVQIELLEVIGDAYQQLGEYDLASEVVERSLVTARIHLGASQGQTLVLARQLASLCELRGELTKAERLARLAVTGLGARPEHRHELAVAEGRLASILGRQGESEEAERLLSSAISSQRQLLGNGHPNLAFSLHELGLLLFKKRHLEPSEALTREALGIWQAAHGDDHPDTLACRKQLAYALLEQGELEEAEILTRQVLTREKTLYTGPHPSMAFTLARLARLSQLQGDLGAAEDLARQALELRVQLFPERHPAIGVSRYKLAEILLLRGEASSAEQLFEISLEVLQEKLPNNVLLAHPWLGLGRARLEHEPAEAESMILEALKLRRSSLPADDLLVLETEIALGRALMARGKSLEAKARLEDVAARLNALRPSAQRDQLLARAARLRTMDVG